MAPTDIGFCSLIGHRLFFALFQFGFVKPGAKHVPRCCAVFMLRPLLLAGDDDAGRNMCDTHGRVRRVDVLAARARGAERIDPAI